ncbi:MAG: hypothetical protein RIR18_2391 [Pseudomonadota bacterium]|jgi:hypothetical protein
MKVNQTTLSRPDQLATALTVNANADLLLVFADVSYFRTPAFATVLQVAYPKAVLLGCSTAGEISAKGVDDGRCVLTSAEFDSAKLETATTVLNGMEDSQAAGERVAKQLSTAGLKAVMVFGPGVNINGSAMVRGMEAVLGTEVPITGGLAGDAGAFTQTYTLGKDGVSDQAIVAIGLYGEKLNFAHGSFGGWEPFGPSRKVTRCAGNVLFELDGEPALEVYERYLGDFAKDLPSSGLLFPFAMLSKDLDENGLIRTILAVDKATGSLTLAGEIDTDGYLRLMHASTDGLVSGAESAAKIVQDGMQTTPENALGILVSCVGRKLVMGDRVEEEVEIVGDMLGRGTTLTGFYSYGEISPFIPAGACRLHNQTMTITSISEV